MKGDFTRSTFRPARRYTSVRMQQGRVQLDADWNEQIDIQAHLDQTQAKDVIGLCGVPKEGGGFAIGLTADQGDLTISPGRIYVEGILCENATELRYGGQPQLPAPPFTTTASEVAGPALALGQGFYLVYLDVWQRHVTALEDPLIREVALGGPDTSTRTQTVWQVRLLELGALAETPACVDDLAAWQQLTAPSSGRLAARSDPGGSSSGPCIIPPGGGFRRLENQLYRVEIHAVQPDGSATFKWSRDNGSIVSAWLEQDGDNLIIASPGRDTLLGFAGDNLVELTGDTQELHGQPGTLVRLASAEGQILTIDPATATGSTSRVDFLANPKVRRWDAREALDVVISNGQETWLSLEDGVQVKFEAGSLRPGDYWLIPARSAVGDVEWPRDGANQPLAELPHGIGHHYCKLALLRVDAQGVAVVEDCRARFPSLTEICAEDICFDNDNCQLPGAANVQEALDQLCAQRDLRHHNKHLHGWGIVCGLQVHCGPMADGRRANVTVRPGYAIDCEGNDLVLEEDRRVDVLRQIEELARGNPDTPILNAQGDGEVCLTLDGGPEGLQVGVEPYRAPQDDLRALLAGSLLMDVYLDCIKPLEDFFREQLTPPPEEKGRPVGPVQERLAVFTNLMGHVVNPQAGQHLFISPREHAIMEEFYRRLRALLQSETFCAMFENARPFPEYPFPKFRMDTLFGRGNHTRLRLRPGTRPEAYTVGPGLDPRQPATTINRYDLKANRLVSRVDPLAGVELGGQPSNTGAGDVQDIAFSADGRQIYIVAPTRNGANTFFRVGEIGSGSIKWRPVVTICGVKLVTLATTAADARFVYAIGQGKGLYRIDPEAVDPNMAPLVPFNAVGHLLISADGRAFATGANPSVQPTAYDRIVGASVPDGRPIFGSQGRENATQREFLLGARGDDDIAIVTRQDGAEVETLYAVVEPRTAGDKQIGVYDLNLGTPRGDPVDVENTTIRLQPLPTMGVLLLTSEDGYHVREIDLATNTFNTGYLLPMQVGPIAIAADAEQRNVYVLNYVSNTIVHVGNPRLFNPKFRFPVIVLSRYREQILEAFADLLGGFLQYLKDCVCDHLLVKCPTCDEDEKIYLACVSIRDNQVYKVCNFSKRRYVKSFPTMGYWLSFVPVIPLIDKAVEEFCCMVLPELFSRFEVADYNRTASRNPAARVRLGGLRRGVSSAQAIDFGTRLRELIRKGSTAGGVLKASLASSPAGSASAASEETAPVALSSKALVGQPAEPAAAQLEEQGLTVKRAPFDPARSGTLLSNLTGFFRTPTAGSTVTLFEEDGVVRYYSVEKAAAQEAVELRSRSAARTGPSAEDDELAQLRGQVAAQQEKLSQFEAELSELRKLLRPGDEA